MTGNPPIPEGWIPWSGGECPVDPDACVRVLVRQADGKAEEPTYRSNVAPRVLAGEWHWSIPPHMSGAIIAYLEEPNHD